MNASLQRDFFANAGRTDYSAQELIGASLNMERPKLPAPHQVAGELYKLVVDTAPTSKRSLVYHGAITLEETLIGFAIGSGLGIGLAILIVSMRWLERSMMPWIVASQTIPIIALAPMIVVILNQFNITGVAPKAAIAAYLSFFPVTVGMVKGFRSPDPLQLDLMRTYSATRAQTFLKLRAPASAPFFFTSMKIGAAAALVGAVVAEVTKSEDGGLGARLLAGSYYGQTVQIWAALFAAAALSAALVGVIGLIGRRTRSVAWGSSREAPLHRPRPAANLRHRRARNMGRRGFGSSMCRRSFCPRPRRSRRGSPPPCQRSPPISGRRFQGVLAGYVIGSLAGFVIAILIDRSQFLQHGLMPIGNLVSALPIVGIAPIMVMWFGFDWQSKAAVVVVMTFFPMLVNTVAGLAGAGAIERDLMKTYGADYWQTLLALRLPVAMPFVFNALKINTTLAMIGAIVAEFFGTPIVGMGFRISTEVGRLGIDMVWATIVVAALTGSLFYALVAGVERRVTFWHASYRAEEA